MWLSFLAIHLDANYLLNVDHSSTFSSQINIKLIKIACRYWLRLRFRHLAVFFHVVFFSRATFFFTSWQFVSQCRPSHTNFNQFFDELWLCELPIKFKINTAILRAHDENVPCVNRTSTASFANFTFKLFSNISIFKATHKLLKWRSIFTLVKCERRFC